MICLALVLQTCGGGSGVDRASGISPLTTQSWVRDPGNPVLVGNGAAICHVFDPTVIHDNGLFRMWFGFVGFDINHAMIGYAESADGSHWTAGTSPVFWPSQDPTAWDN